MYKLQFLILSLILLATIGCSDSSNRRSTVVTPPAQPEPADVTAFNATLHRTEGGIPHIVAEDWGSIGYGTGYAAAQDHFCAQSRNLLKFRGQLAQFLGPDDGNLDSDVFFALLEELGIYNEVIDPEFEALFAGYAAGFNRYLSETGIDSISDPTCQGAEWVQAMTADDVRRFHLTPAFLPNFARFIVPAVPPVTVAAAELRSDLKNENAVDNEPALPKLMTEPEKIQLAALANSAINPYDKGSNGIAIGGELSADGSGLLYTNPHLDWQNFDFRMYGMHQIIPGLSNMLGANQAQRAHVGFGTNGNVAWTNTVSTSQAFMFYRLDLVPGNPLAYIFNGEVRDMEALDVTVNTLDESGNVIEFQRTFYRSHLGLMMGGQFPWAETFAFSLRIANEGARGFQGGAMAMARATNVRELKAAINTYQSTPGINTIAADSSGEVLYGDLGPVVNFTDEQLAECNFTGPVFYGRSSDCEWNTDEDSAVPGLLGASKQASLFRRDYVTNSNDSYWLANPAEPITGIPLIHGDINTERSMRTRAGLYMIEARRNGSDGLPGNRFDLDNLIERSLSNLSVSGMLLRDDLVTLCDDNSWVELNGQSIDIRPACPVLRNWDLSANLDSRGEHLFREFMRALGGSSTLPAALNPKIPFDISDPVNTPAGMNSEDNPAALTALASAVELLTEAGIPLDARLGDIQGITRNATRIPLHGGEQFEGILNKMSYILDNGEYSVGTASGASWVMATKVAGDATQVKGLTAYSQSSDSTSENFFNLTEQFSAKNLVDIPFLLEDVEAAALTTDELSVGTSDCSDGGWQSFTVEGFSSEEACRESFQNIYDNRVTGFSR
ncbi:MAG: penicillin acylase family protein [Halioglobus sp.]